MREFEGRVAVVTGAASGIGRGLAGRFAREGMRVVLADVEKGALDAAVLELKRQERDVIGVVTDVSRPEAVEELARRTFETYGNVHVLCNNAGVSGGGVGPIWQATMEDWRWVFGVNFWGVVHGVRAFLPTMIEKGEEGHIVNTASIMGLNPAGGIYGATKHGVVSFSETLYQQLGQAKAKVGVSVLCPGHVPTRITSSARNRPAELLGGAAPPDEAELAARDRMWAERGGINSMPPEAVADKVFEGINEGIFYILPHATDAGVRRRFEAILSRRGPEVLQVPF